ncbi:MAG: hypothetical protein SAJ12_02380 [Jaaginema sp. PMC 1079.18]|nr:hypothetical protein [Jaaginema sp. PMC 1080.18]MEC4849836.1 hypothetical protein [Jaaginema sp. PMC 1079.18]MEC4864549.1 hypothetical protein [Jaaginema sp. PMC 1078.18]
MKKPSHRLLRSLFGGLVLWSTSNLHAPTANAAPFVCNGTLYISQAAGETSPTGLFDVIANTTPFGLGSRGGAFTRYNAMGFRYQDGYIYGIDPGTTGQPNLGGEIFRIDDTGQPVSLGTPPQVAALQAAGNRFIAGDFMTTTNPNTNGLYFIYSNSPNGQLVVLNVDNSPPTVEKEVFLAGQPRFADIAFNAVDGKFYGYDVAAQQIRFFDPNTVLASANGNTVPVSNIPAGTGGPGANQIGAAFFDASGTFYGYANNGNLYTADITTGNFRNLGSAPQVSQNDGAGCPLVPLFQKIPDSTSVPLGGTATYRYRVINNTDFALNNIQFVENVNDGSGRTITGVTNPFGGTQQLNPGGTILTITGLTIPARTTSGEIVVTMQMPTTQPATPLPNQALLLDSNNNPIVSSDDPSTPPLGDSTNITVQPTPGPAEVTIQKTGPANLTAPGQATYTITATNQSTVNTAINVMISDVIATGATFVRASEGGTYDTATRTVTWPTINIPPNSPPVTRTVTVNLPTSNPTAPGFENTATVNSTNDVLTTNNTATVGTVIPAAAGNADIVTTKSGPLTLAAPGQASYVITVTNNGPDTATDVVIQDVLAGTDDRTPVIASDGGTYNPGTRTVTWPTISIPPNTTVTRTVTVTYKTTGTFDNTASGNSPDDSTPGNNSSTVQTNIPASGSADIVLTKIGLGTNPLPSPGEVTYVIEATNNGPNSAVGVIITDEIDPDSTFVSASEQWSFSGGVVTWSAVNIAPGDSVTRTVTVNLPIAKQPQFTNFTSSTFAPGSPSTDPNPANNTRIPASTTVTDQPDLAISKDQTGSYVTGSAAQYRITVTNKGTQPTDGSLVTVTDTLPTGPPGLTPTGANGTGWNCTVTGQTVECTRSDVLQPGSSYPPITLAVTVNGAVGSNITNTSTVSGGGDNNPNNNSDIEDVVVIGLTDPDLTVAKQVDPNAPLVPGGVGNYILTVTNSGPGSTTAPVRVIDNLPSGLTLNGSATGNGWTCTVASRTITCTRNDALASGQSYPPITVPVSVTAAPGSQVTNSATVSGGGDPNLFNNGSTNTTTIGSTGGQIGLAKGASQPVANGDGTFNVVYTLLVRNFSNVALSSVQVTDNLFGNQNSTYNGATSFQVVSPPTVTGALTQGNPNFNGAGNLLSGTETLAVGQSATISLQVRVNPGGNPGPYNNQATTTARDPNGNLVSDLSANSPDIDNDGVPDLNPDPNGNGNPSDDSEPTPVTFPVSGSQFRLVKRITGVTRDGSPLSGVDFSRFVDDANDPDDNADWTGLTLAGFPALGDDNVLQSDDVVEYTIYYLADGSQTVTNARICDAIPQGTTFVSNSFSGSSGIQLRQGTTESNLTNEADSDKGQFFSPLSRADSVVPPCPDANNPTGAVFVNLGDVPNTGTNRLGFVRFRVKLD